MALKGKQKKLDKNNNGRIDAQDFKILQGSKKGMRMGGMMYAKTGVSVNEREMMRDKDRMTTVGEFAKSRAKSNKVLENTIKTLMSKRSPTATEGSFKTGGVMKAKSGKFMDRRKELGGLSDDKKDSKFLERRLKLSKKKSGGVMKAKSGDLADTMKKLRKRAYEKSMKKSKKVGRFGDDEYLIQKPLPGMKKGKMIKAKTGKYVFDMIAVKPMSGLNKNKKKDGFLDDVFEKTIKKYGLKDPTKKK